MREELIVLPLREIDSICDQCLGAFRTNLFENFPKPEVERPRRRAEMARRRE
jgi:hypothetical protein